MAKNQTTQTQSSTSQPWMEAQPALKNILGQVGGINPGLTDNESGALDQTIALARAGSPYAPALQGYTTTMLAGGGPDRTGLLGDAYNDYKKNLAGTAAGDYLDPNKNPFFANTTNAISDDVQNRVNGMFAGAGRDLSGANIGTLGSEITKATAPIYANVYQGERANQLNAFNSLYGAGNTTAGALSNLDQIKLGNQTTGVNFAQSQDQAQYDPYNRILAAEAAKRGIPMSTLQQLAGITTPIAGLGGDRQGTSTTSQPSQVLPALIGGGIAAAGVMSGNPMMAMGGMGSAMGGLNGMSPQSGGMGGSFFPGNPGAAGATPGFMPGYGYYPMFR